MRLTWRGVTLEFQVLMFGLSIAPWIFSKVMKVAVSFFRSGCERETCQHTEEENCLFHVSGGEGIRMSSYLDDWLMMEKRKRAEKVLEELILPQTELLGMTWGVKLDWAPSTRKEFRGFLWDSEKLTFCITERMQRKLMNKSSHIMRQERVKRGTLASFAGTLQSQKEVFQPTRVILWSCYEDIGYDLTPAQMIYKWKWEEMIPVSERTRKALEWFRKEVENWKERSLRIQETTRNLIVDASHLGWGAKLEGEEAGGPWGEDVPRGLGAQPFREMMAIKLALLSFQKELQGRRVVLISDCSGVVYSLKNLKRTEFGEKALEILEMCLRWKIRIDEVCWIDTAEMVKVGVDGISRMSDSNDWILDQQMFERVALFFGRPTCDRFASWTNHKAAKFNTWLRQPHSDGVNAFAQDWTRDLNYACPPLALVGRVLELIWEQNAEAIVILPDWRGTWWWPKLSQRTKKKNFLWLGYGREIFREGPSGIVAPWKNSGWSFWAVKLEKKERLEKKRR
jgi:hypothetical protein